MNAVTLLFAALLLASILVQLWLDWRQARSVAQHRDQLPTAFADQISLTEHQKAADYTLDKLRFGKLDLLLSTLLLLFWTLGGGLNALDQFWVGMAWSPLVQGVVLLLSVMLLSQLLGMPMEMLHTFVLEARHGFNRSTVKLYLLDQAKGLLLTVLIAVPLLALLLWIMAEAGPLWWLYAAAVWVGFMLLMTWAYPLWIAPIFNRFTPLEEGEVKTTIERLLQRTGFTSSGVFVMDGSRRSGHGNAYFTGFGKAKRVVFFDTLLHTLSAQEVEAVLAHELGHYHCKHIQKRLWVMVASFVLGFAVLGWLSQQAAFFHGLGVTRLSDAMALVLFAMVMPLATFFISPLSALMSRKHEFEADAFAAKHARADDLQQALVKLYKENASTLTPDAVYSAFYDSHPPASIRIQHLQRAATA